MSGLDQKGTKYPNGIDVPAGKLFIDEVAVTPTAAELNLLDGSVAGTAVAGKALVVDANKQVDTFGLSVGAWVKGSRFDVTYPQVAAADVAKTFFIAPTACKVVSAYERHVTVAGQAGALNIEKLTTGQAPGAGGYVLAADWDMTSTANTPVSKAAVATAVGTLAAGDALCLRLVSGAATSYALGTITVTMEVV